MSCFIIEWAGMKQSVWQLATDWMVRSLNPGGGKVFCTGPGAYSAFCKMGTSSLSWVKVARAWCWSPTAIQCRA